MKHERHAILVLSVVFCCSCSSQSATPKADGDRARAAAATVSAASQSELAPFAMGYQPKAQEAEQGGEAAIARAQARAGKLPDKAESYVALAEAFLVRRRETADASYLAYAKDAVSAARSLAPRDPRVLTTQIMLYFDDHRFADAAAMARKVIAADAGNASGYLLLSDALLELGDYDGAIEALQAAMDRSPDLRAYSRAAHLRWLHGDVEGAMESMNDALAAASRSPEPMAFCYVDLGTMLWHDGEIENAARAAERALALVPDYAPALALQARILAAQGRDDLAIAKLENVVARAPSAQALITLSELSARQGRADVADDWLKQALELAGHDPVPVALHYARHGIHPERALTLADKALAKRATIHTRDAHALALLRAGKAAEAKEAITAALALGTPDASLLLHRGLIELALGEREAAAASLAAASEQNPHADPLLSAELSRALGQELAAK